jgi:hypothetical protein
MGLVSALLSRAWGVQLNDFQGGQMRSLTSHLVFDQISILESTHVFLCLAFIEIAIHFHPRNPIALPAFRLGFGQMSADLDCAPHGIARGFDGILRKADAASVLLVDFQGTIHHRQRNHRCSFLGPASLSRGECNPDDQAGASYQLSNLTP